MNKNFITLKRIPKLVLAWVLQGLMASSALAAGDHDHGNDHAHDHHEHASEHHTRISEGFARDAGVSTETAGPRSLRVTETLYGVVQPNRERLVRIRAPYPGAIVELNASLGDSVNEGAVLARVKSRESLETYSIRAPISGVVTERHLNVGELAESEPLLELTDLSDVWLQLLAYPQQAPLVRQGQPVVVRDLTRTHTAQATIDYIAPVRQPQNQGTAVRATVNNDEGVWSPGMMVIGDLITDEREVPMAVNRSALQTMDGDRVVFVREGERYEARRVELGEGDRDYVAVTDGLEAGAEYVTENSYLIKADILKSGAGHDH